MPTPRVAALVPCYNTSRASRPVIEGAARVCDRVLAVDDGSTDDTAAHLAASPCEMLALRPNRGKGAAIEAGVRRLLDRASGAPVDYVVVIDGDGQHAPDDIPGFLAVAAAGSPDLVIGVREARAMPCKNRIGAHYSRLAFLIGTSRFVADTQCGFRLMSVPLLRDILDRVRWRGYEAESEVLRRALERQRPVEAVPISTIYIDGNRRSRFRPWRDSSRIAAVFAPQIAWTVAMAALDVAIYAGLVSWRGLAPVAATLISRPAAVAIHLAIRRDAPARLERLAGQQGVGSVATAFAGHLGLTAGLVGGLHALGAAPVPAKLLGQLAGYLAGFAIADRVMLRRTARRADRSAGRGRSADPPTAP